MLGVVRSGEMGLIPRWIPPAGFQSPVGVQPRRVGGSFRAKFVCWRAKRGTSLATGPDFWEATKKPEPPEPA